MNENYQYGNQQYNTQKINEQITQSQRMLDQLKNGQQVAQPNYQQQSNSYNETGIYVYVSNYSEVINYPVSIDGKATLFICLQNEICWVKKMINGVPSIQTFSLKALNEVLPTKEVIKEEPKFVEKTTGEKMNNNFEERLIKIEKDVSSIVQFIKNKNDKPVQAK